MNAKQNVKSVSTIEQDLSSINMPDHVRDAALNGAQLAEVIVGALLSVCHKVGQVGGGASAKLSPKY
jgi:hypothetical protein